MNRVIAVVSLSLVVSCVPCPTPAPACPSTGTGTIVVTSTGLPSGVTGTIHLTGPTAQTVTSSRTLSVGAGAWSVTADRATSPDPFVRTVYLPTVSPATFCLPSGGTQDVIVTWAPVATSNKLWATNSNATGQFLGFRSAQLARSATVTADVVSRGGFGADVAFDRDGNVWSAGGTTADAALQRFPAASFATSAMVTPDLQISIGGASCTPLIAGLAFNANGDLYVSSPCRNEVLRLEAASLAAGGTVTPSLSIVVQDPNGIAFDRAGNLWVAARMDSRVWRYDAAQLDSGSVSVPAFKRGALASDDPMNTSLQVPGWLAFDARGDLWANDFAGNTFYRMGAASLRGTGSMDVQPQVRITLAVLALLEGFAFDEEGGLWSAGAMGMIVRLAPVQLDVSSSAGSPTRPATVLTSTDIGSAVNLAFYPAPAGLPLYDALP
jgi:sugar lactone lactonase YvrE